MKPHKLRKTFLEKAHPLVDQYVEAALGEGSLKGTSGIATGEVWDTLKQIILMADDPITAVWADKEAHERIDFVLLQVAGGDLTPEEGKRLVALISLGIDATILPELVAKMNAVT